jgi:hypothetical protein
MSSRFQLCVFSAFGGHQSDKPAISDRKGNVLEPSGPFVRRRL